MLASRVLVVEDEPVARDLLVAILESDGYSVCAVPDGAIALAEAQTFKPDLALVDAGLPGIHGAEVARRLRQTGDVPIIFVTGADTAENIHDAFRMGADDYILKPFDPEELSWRVRAVLRRSGQSVPQSWECGDLIVDEATHLVTRAGAPISVTAIEFQILTILARNRMRVVSKAQLLSQVWGYDADDHLVEVHMSALRGKLEAHEPRMIQTVRGAGYVLRPGAAPGEDTAA
ncbi:MAG TPA: response regulator transcription factor [Acidimicrobiales bacterium]|nr:response regulator transcription factor [Acidimicrobiales bacterium]